METNFLAGLAMSLSLIVAIGAQNAFVLRQGIRKEHVFAVVAVCAFSDLALITAGTFGLGRLVHGNDRLLTATRYGGAAFLLAYGLLAGRRALSDARLVIGDRRPATLSATLSTCLGLTFLNPHVYLDTVVLLGTIANQRPEDGRWLFAAGASLASVLWFTGLGYGARALKPLFERPAAWRVLDAGIALTMFALGFGLLK